MWYDVADRMPVILGNNDSVNVWLNDASVKLEEITAPYEGADLVSPCYALCYHYIHYLLAVLVEVLPWPGSVGPAYCLFIGGRVSPLN